MQKEGLQASRDCYGRERRQALFGLPRFGSHLLNLKECLHPSGGQKTRCPLQGLPLCTRSSLGGEGPPKSLQLRARHSPELPASVSCCAPQVFTYEQQHFFSSAFEHTPSALQSSCATAALQKSGLVSSATFLLSEATGCNSSSRKTCCELLNIRK